MERLFDDSSLVAEGQPVAVILAGCVAAGKTTMRKRDYSTGYVLIDAADIFLSLSRDVGSPTPGETEESVGRIGSLVARLALSERRNVVNEIIGAEPGPVGELVEALKSIGYTVKGAFLTCDLEEALRRNDLRGEDDISAYDTEPFQRRWIIEACKELAEE